MSTYPSISARPLDPFDLIEATSLAHSVGVHGMYISNSLGEFSDLGGDEVLGFYGAESLLGLAWFGRRGNLILIEREPLDPMHVIPAVAAVDAPWRIALGTPVMVGALAALEDRPVLVNRRQVYYGIDRAAVEADTVQPDQVESLIRSDVRSAERKDIRALVEAALELNEQDLNVDPWRVNRAWLKDSVKRRIKEDRTRVLGPLGNPLCKLDLGSRGLAGVMIEGVYTLREERGKGLATGLVATVCAEALAQHELVCLHVDAQNQPARRAYERAGMRELGVCQLLLRS